MKKVNGNGSRTNKKVDINNFKRSQKMEENEIEFLQNSNWIERETSQIAMEDAITAWNFAKKHRHMINIEFIKTIHQELMIRLNLRIAGNIRECCVSVGGRECLKPEVLEFSLKHWIRNWSKKSTWKGIKQAHIQFEKIHPFEDGNGRVGRIIMNIQRLNANLPILIIQEEEKFEYYKWFT